MNNQARLYIQGRMIIGLIFPHNHKRKFKKCKWCGNSFIPHHNSQAFCDNICRNISRQKYKSDWMNSWRIRSREGSIVNDRAILNVGTGGLGEHMQHDFRAEQQKVRKELKELGLR